MLEDWVSFRSSGTTHLQHLHIIVAARLVFVDNKEAVPIVNQPAATVPKQYWRYRNKVPLSIEELVLTNGINKSATSTS